MQLPDRLRCLFSATVEERADSYVVEVPKREIQGGGLTAGRTYRVAVLSSPSNDETNATDTEPEREQGPPAPPVEEGDQRAVEIEALGDQGDGIARVERGFVVIVPDTEQGERVTVEITDVNQNVAFGDVVERLSFYE